MKFDRKKFYDAYRKEFKGKDGKIEEYEVEGLNGLLWGFETYWGWWDFIPQIANALAQVKIESAHSFLPVQEGFYLAKNVSKDKKYFQGGYDIVQRFRKRLAYFPYDGKGHIQLTHLYNYQKHDKLLRFYFPEIVAEFEQTYKQKLNLVAVPTQMFEAKVSFCVMTIGMHKGTFRGGHTLDRYVNPVRINHFGARDIVNGDKNYVKSGNIKVGQMVTNYAVKFERVLKYSLIPESVAAPVLEMQLNPDAEIVSGALDADFDDGTTIDAFLPENAPETPENAKESAFNPNPNIDSQTHPVDNSFPNNAKDESFPTITNPQFNEPANQPETPPDGDNKETVYIQKPKSETWFQRMWAKLTGGTTGNLSLQAATDQMQEVGGLGLSAKFWTIAGIAVAIGTIVWLIYEWQKKRQDDAKQLALTELLVKENSTQNNRVEFVEFDQADYFASRGLKVIKR